MIDKKNNNIIMCIETTSNICGVALVAGDEILYENNLDTGLNHSITLFNNIHNALNKLNISVEDIKKIKVSNGPGSFTGLRIGIAAALGLAKPYNTKIEYVDTLDSLAHNICYTNNINSKSKKKFKINNSLNSNYNSYILSMIDARVDRVYISLYNAHTFEKISNDNIINVYELCNLLNNIFINTKISFCLIGSGATNYKDIFINKLRINYNLYDNLSNLCAKSLIYTNGIISDIPFTNYLLASKAERERQKFDNN